VRAREKANLTNLTFKRRDLRGLQQFPKPEGRRGERSQKRYPFRFPPEAKVIGELARKEGSFEYNYLTLNAEERTNTSSTQRRERRKRLKIGRVQEQVRALLQSYDFLVVTGKHCWLDTSVLFHPTPNPNPFHRTNGRILGSPLHDDGCESSGRNDGG
jgi:hypothetical protein